MSGLFDLPVEELSLYKGTNPLPEDFDVYWNVALAELDQIDSDLDFIDAEFQVPSGRCKHFFFTGVANARIHAKIVFPNDIRRPMPAIIFFHGYRAAAAEWSYLLSFVGAGFVVAALDCRGQAGLSVDAGGVRGNTQHGHIIRGLIDGPEKLLYRNIFLDTAQLARLVMDLEEVDSARVGAYGGSQGGGLSIACAALEPRINRVVARYPFLSDYKRVWDLDLAENAYAELREFFRKFDPLHENEMKYFKRLGYIDVQHFASRIKADFLMGTGLMDKVCPPSTQYAIFNKVTSSKDIVIYPDYEHEVLPGFDDRAIQFMLGM